MSAQKVVIGNAELWLGDCQDVLPLLPKVDLVCTDPPYSRGEMDYAAGGVGGELASQVREWCAKNGGNRLLRIVLCGHAGEHDALIERGWHARTWTARKGYALTDEAVANSASETLWCSPHCVPEVVLQDDLFAGLAA